MPSPVYITQTQDEEQTILVKQVKDLKLSTTLPTTLTLPTHRSTTSPSLQNSRPTSFIPTFTSAVTSNSLLAPSKCLPDVVGSTFSTNVGDATPSTNRWECYHAKYYYETVKHEPLRLFWQWCMVLSILQLGCHWSMMENNFLLTPRGMNSKWVIFIYVVKSYVGLD